MVSECGLRISRITLAAGVLTAVRALTTSRFISVGNASAADVLLYTNDNEAENEYLVIAPGWEREIRVYPQLLDPTKIGMWLKSTPGGLVVVLWA